MYGNTRKGSQMIYAICFNVSKSKLNGWSMQKFKYNFKMFLTPLCCFIRLWAELLLRVRPRSSDFKRLLEIARLSNIFIRFLILSPRQKGSLDQGLLNSSP